MLNSAAGECKTYLLRFDLSRRLNDESLAASALHRGQTATRHHDISLVISDSFLVMAVAWNAVPWMVALTKQLAPETWSMAPLTAIRTGRVVVADNVADKAGERIGLADGAIDRASPALDFPDSMGVHSTWMQRVGMKDVDRKLHFLLRKMRRRVLSGVKLNCGSTRYTNTAGDAVGPPD